MGCSKIGVEYCKGPKRAESMGSWLIPKSQLGQAEASNADALPLKAQQSVDWDEMATPFRIRIRTHQHCGTWKKKKPLCTAIFKTNSGIPFRQPLASVSLDHLWHFQKKWSRPSRPLAARALRRGAERLRKKSPRLRRTCRTISLLGLAVHLTLGRHWDRPPMVVRSDVCQVELVRKSPGWSESQRPAVTRLNPLHLETLKTNIFCS